MKHLEVEIYVSQKEELNNVVSNDQRYQLRANFGNFILIWLQEIADKEIAALPRDSCPVRIRNRCVLTSRPRGVKKRWRLSRIVFRHLADHNQMSGILRARWWLWPCWTCYADCDIKNSAVWQEGGHQRFKLIYSVCSTIICICFPLLS